MPSIVFTPDGVRVKVGFEYSPAFIAELKAAVPTNKRRWNPRYNIDKKTRVKTLNPGGDDTWTIDLDQVDRVVRIAERFGWDVITLAPDGGGGEVSTDVDGKIDAYRVMFAGVSSEHLKRLWRFLNKVYHPDLHPGEQAKYTALIAQVNAGYDRVKKERG